MGFLAGRAFHRYFIERLLFSPHEREKCSSGNPSPTQVHAHVYHEFRLPRRDKKRINQKLNARLIRLRIDEVVQMHLHFTEFYLSLDENNDDSSVKEPKVK